MKNPLLTDAGIARHIAKGHGQGKGSTYRPWIEIRHVPSEGKSSRDEGWKTNRVINVLSQLELRAHYLFNWNDEIIDLEK
jgi:hypothetical protein